MAAAEAALFNKDKVNKMHAWKNKEIVDTFLTNTRNAIPCGGEQLDLLLRIVSQSQRSIKNFIDLGCGDGILANTILAQYPMAKGLLIDYSPEMIKAAKSRLAKYDNQRIVKSDLATCEWKHHINDNPELVISGLAIHHLKNGRKYELFEDTNQQDVLTFIEEWESQEDLKNHSNSAHFTRIVPKLGEFTSKPMEISVYKKLI